MDNILRQRKELALAAAEFGDSMSSLAKLENNKPLSHSLTQLGDLQQQVKELYWKQVPLVFHGSPGKKEC